jgi:uncharacterized protein (TIGR02284 family)
MTNDVLDTLNHLIERARDAEQGLRTAAAAVDDAAMQRRLLEHAQHHAACVAELQAHVRRLGGMPPHRGTVAGTLQRALFNLEEALRGRNGEATIRAVLRIEDATLAAYRDARQISSLPADVRAVIEDQLRRADEARAALGRFRRAA